MRTNLAIALLIYPMVQAVAFGLGLLAVLSIGVAQTAMPWMIAATVILSVPVAWLIAPRLRSRRWRAMRQGAGFSSAGSPAGRAGSSPPRLYLVDGPR